MKKMTLVRKAVLDPILERQIAREIQQTELSTMVQIRTQIEDTLTNSKLTDIEQLYILERAQEKYCTIKELMRPTKWTIVQGPGTAPASSDLAST